MTKFIFVLDGDFSSCCEVIRKDLRPFYAEKLGLKCTNLWSNNPDILLEAIAENRDGKDMAFVYCFTDGDVDEVVGKLCAYNPESIVKVLRVESCSGGLCYRVIDPRLTAYDADL